ncbi:hypothetical protein PFICI_02329 [Pestalotiopsis fici W106-1]|uniref:Enoyl reductase (ER) domain-containing protein n=1 Tax=Pestalotiopsis fici (strain W106-1 / CGMCC3.15140) TaxID=1229662 RepID=W3XE71_PESFW|nr:uncharacterized protein PFICI_02329 [Pestalotiopsis fici W106-1]ETS84304.1 hypothetical protein PFICI_02329 [Pestalotiopsis fici W106-1]
MTLTKDYQKAAREGGSPRFEIHDVPRPALKPWEVLVSLSASGICGTDVSLASGHLGPCCDILGHEGVGKIEAIGAGVDPTIAKIGDRVGIAWVRDACGACEYCLIPGGETRCVEQLNSGRKIDGTFAEFCTVPSRYLLKLPDDLAVADELVAPILCGGVTAYKALKSCNATPGSWVAISGAGGGVGALAIQYARAMGYRVIAIDVGTSKEEYCRSLGAEVYLDAKNDVAAAVYTSTKGTRAKAVIVTAGSGAAYQSAFDIVAAFGTVVCVGIPPPPQTMALHPLQFIDKGISLIGSLTGTRTDTLEALEFVQRGAVKPSVNIISLNDLPVVADRVAETTGKYVIRFGKAQIATPVQSNGDVSSNNNI